MGFAVVADEVRNLAQRSAQAANETGALIADSVSLTREAATKLQELLQATEENSQHAGRVKELVDLVTAATERQARAITEIANVLPQLEQAPQRTAAGAEESAAAGEELSGGAGSLRRAAENLNSIVNGSAAFVLN